MPSNDKAVLVYSTFPALDLAERVGAELVDARLAACVNILPRMISIYRWQGVRHRDEEVVMLIKTRESLSSRVISAVREQHPYDNPALLVLPTAGGSGDFLSWILSETVGEIGARDTG
ncbi:MAG: divalent-cation tolerance protein CutA [Hyphomicrobium sp.]